MSLCAASPPLLDVFEVAQIGGMAALPSEVLVVHEERSSIDRSLDGDMTSRVHLSERIHIRTKGWRYLTIIRCSLQWFHGAVGADHEAGAPRDVCLLFKDAAETTYSPASMVAALHSQDGLHFKGPRALVMPRGTGRASLHTKEANGIAPSLGLAADGSSQDDDDVMFIPNMLHNLAHLHHNGEHILVGGLHNRVTPSPGVWLARGLSPFWNHNITTAGGPPRLRARSLVPTGARSPL